MKKTSFIILHTLILATLAFAQERYVRPVDEAAQDPSFLAFRVKLIAAAERRDSAYILSIVDRNIKNGFGGSDGVANFRRGWKLPGRNSSFWKEFLPVIKNGGAFNDGVFMSPYTFSSWPNDIDGFEYDVIFGNNVNLRERPDLRSRVIAQLSYNVVKIESQTVPKSGRSEYPDWRLVRTMGGLRGYVKKEYVRNHIDFRAGFEKKRGVWKMTFFLAGD